MDSVIRVPEAPAGVGSFELDPLADPRWDTLVSEHPLASVFHSIKWLAALKNAYGYEPFVLTTCPAHTELTNGIVFCRVKSKLTGWRLVSLPFSDHCEPLVNSSEELNYLLGHAKGFVGQGAWKYVEIRPVSQCPEPESGFEGSLSYVFHRLNLEQSKEKLFRSFHKDCVQRKIRRAERQGLIYEEGRSNELLKKFYHLVIMTRRRQHLPPQPFYWFRALASAIGDDLKIRIASKDGVPVAGILTLAHKRVMTYKYGCSDAAYNNLGGTPFLLWKAIEEAVDRGMDEFDMGRSDLDNSGLIEFKERWGPERALLKYWTHPNTLHEPRPEWQRNVARKIVSVAPSSILQAVGTALYKHIG